LNDNSASSSSSKDSSVDGTGDLLLGVLESLLKSGSVLSVDLGVTVGAVGVEIAVFVTGLWLLNPT
jgi:hypothetical protein